MNPEAALAQAKFDALQRSIAGLNEDPKFHQFLDEIRNLKNMAVRDLCNDSTIGNDGRLRAAIGEVRCYLGILDAASAGNGQLLD